MTGIKATLLIAAVFAVALHNQAVADDVSSEAMETAANNLSHEMVNCSVFYTVGAICVLRSNRSNRKDVSEQLRKTANTYQDFAAMLGERAGISKLDEVLKARTNIAREDMFNLMDRDCRNVSIVLDKYGKRCKAIGDDSAAALKDYMKGDAVR